MILASIFIDSSPVRQENLPPTVLENIESLKRCHPGLRHVFFDDDAIRGLLKSDFDKNVLHAYETLNPYAYKADLACYCILHRYGGVYADLSMCLLKEWLPQDNKLAVFKDFGTSAPWDTVVGLIAAPPKHKALSTAIDLVCANVKNEYYGTTSLCPTGPTLFGKAIALSTEPGDVVSGFSALFSPFSIKINNERRYYFSQRVRFTRNCHGLFSDVSLNSLVAVKRKNNGGDLKELGITSVNNYNQFWSAGRVYKS